MSIFKQRARYFPDLRVWIFANADESLTDGLKRVVADLFRYSSQRNLCSPHADQLKYVKLQEQT